MNEFSLVPIHAFRIKLPDPLFPYRGKESIKSCLLCELSGDDGEWREIRDLGEIFPSSFEERNPMNVPGPIFGAETDTCATGPHEAPHNVLLDRNGQEFVFRQPSNAHHFRDVVGAAISECLGGYGADGDEHWRLSSIREWWRNRNDMLSLGVHQEYGAPGSIAAWRAGLQGAYLPYLRAYGFFVENGRLPNNDDFLPDI